MDLDVIPPGGMLTTLFIAGLTFYMNNYNPFPKKAIIAQNNALVMSAPSSASIHSTTEKKGNRITVIDDSDNWYYIQLEDTSGYTKKGNVNVIEAY